MTTQTEATKSSLSNMESTSQTSSTKITHPATTKEKSVQEEQFESGPPDPSSIWLEAMYILIWITIILSIIVTLLTDRKCRDKIARWRRSLQASFRTPRWLRVLPSTEPGILRFDVGIFVVIAYFLLCITVIAFPFVYCLLHFIRFNRPEMHNTGLLVVGFLLPGCFASVALVHCVLDNWVLERDLEYAEERSETNDEEKGEAGGQKYTDTSSLLMSEV
ncbi:hypothetical protein QBC37DRAFT_125120 [Rhypophila decipiens]|uniref:Uncharacterized protein n=1 Tax=Rhypophila decipiens TaxID=261697 RepID=A0AAN6Y9X8_9PEZI|nr:hypothetical protein QBC37DRAFT_125120 [Rhypophila decipiens]